MSSISSDTSTTTFDLKEERSYLEKIQTEINGLSKLCFKLDHSVVPASANTAAVLLRLLSYIGRRSDDFLREFRQADERDIGLLAYLGRSIFEAYCILSYLLNLSPQEIEKQVTEQIALDKGELHKNLGTLFPQELKDKLPDQLARWDKLKNGTKRWDISKLINSDSSLSELHKQYYPFFNKFAHPTAFSLFCEDDVGALKAARGAYLVMTYTCLIETTTRFTNSLERT